MGVARVLESTPGAEAAKCAQAPSEARREPKKCDAIEQLIHKQVVNVAKP